MKSELEPTMPRSVSLDMSNARAGAGTVAQRRSISGLLDEILKLLAFGVILTWLIYTVNYRHSQGAPAKFSTETQTSVKTNHGIWAEGPAQIPCTSPNHGLKLASTPGSSGRSWNFLMLVDGPLVKNSSNPFLVVQMRTWRACYFEEWMLEMDVVQQKEDSKAPSQVSAGNAEDWADWQQALGQVLTYVSTQAQADHCDCNISGINNMTSLETWEYS